MQSSPETPDGGPSLWWVWGDIKERLGELRSLTLANRQAVIDQVVSLQQRQDDMRREWLYHSQLLHKRLEAKPSAKHRYAWLAHIPWDRIVVFLGGALGALGWIKPQWIKLITGQ